MTCGNYSGCRENCQRDAQVEAATLFGEVCRSQVDGNSGRWKLEVTILNGALDAISCFADRCLRQSNDRKSGQPTTQVRFDGNARSIDAVLRTRVHASYAL